MVHSAEWTQAMLVSGGFARNDRSQDRVLWLSIQSLLPIAGERSVFGKRGVCAPSSCTTFLIYNALVNRKFGCGTFAGSAMRLLTVPRSVLEKAVEAFFAAVEAVDLVFPSKLLDGPIVAHSKTLGVVSKASRRGRGFTGASSAATKASYCLAPRRNSRRSASVSAAASSPLSSRKALKLLCSTSAARFTTGAWPTE